MSKFDLKAKAVQLRRTGLSIKDISSTLNISKSTASLWCSQISLTDSQRKILSDKVLKAGLKGRMMGAQSNRKKKENNIREYGSIGKKQIGVLSKRDVTLTAASLYWAEGSKKDGPFSFVNSDPLMIKIIYNWLRINEKVERDQFIVRVAINAIHRERIDKVLKFWSNLLGLPCDSFKSTSFIKTRQKKVYENHDTYYGTLILRVRKSTNLRYKVLGLIEGLKSNLSG